MHNNSKPHNKEFNCIITKIAYSEFKYQEDAFLSRSRSTFVITDYNFANIPTLLLIICSL